MMATLTSYFIIVEICITIGATMTASIVSTNINTFYTPTFFPLVSIFLDIQIITTDLCY